jgi:hypothetical protein
MPMKRWLASVAMGVPLAGGFSNHASHPIVDQMAIRVHLDDVETVRMAIYRFPTQESATAQTVEGERTRWLWGGWETDMPRQSTLYGSPMRMGERRNRN